MRPRRKWLVVKNDGKVVSRCWTERGAERARRDRAVGEVVGSLIVSRLVNGKGNAIAGLADMEPNDFRVERIGDPIDTSNEFRCDCRRHAWTTLLVWCCVIGVVSMFAAIGWGAP
ncbi:hypothetical protein GS532_07660 [Rhodococcus hoagii]|nr:hypothetical protein [Prescottella equi]